MLVSGDVVTLPVDPYDKGSNNHFFDSEMPKLLFNWTINEELSKITPNFYFVPGNHDPDYSFWKQHH